MLPNGWKRDSLSKYVDLISGQHIIASECFNDAIGMPYLTGPIDFTREGKILATKYIKTPKVICAKGNILITVKGSGAGTVAIADKSYCISRQLMAIRPKSINNDFAYFLIINNSTIYRNNAVGLIPGINRNDILNTQVLIPTSGEQKLIATMIRQWDNFSHSLALLILVKQKHQKALMQQLLTGKKRFKEFIKSDKKQFTRFGLIPSDWGYPKVKEIAKEVSLRNQSGRDIPVLSCSKYDGLVESLQYFGKKVFSDDTSNYKIVKCNQFAYPSNHIEEGSIGLLESHNEGIVSPIYTVFETNYRVHAPYLYKVFKSDIYRHNFKIGTSASIDRRGSLRWNKFELIHVPLPSLEEQRKISTCIDLCDKEIQLLRKQLEALQAQKKGLMQKLLTGKIRVKV